jgi:hypothetical protein
MHLTSDIASLPVSLFSTPVKLSVLYFTLFPFTTSNHDYAFNLRYCFTASETVQYPGEVICLIFYFIQYEVGAISGIKYTRDGIYVKFGM